MTDRRVFKPRNATCKKCLAPIGFWKNENKRWVPCNPDGSDHWDACRENLIKGTYGKKKVFKDNDTPMPTYHGNEEILDKVKAGILTLWSDPEIPPWDDSLSEWDWDNDCELVEELDRNATAHMREILGE